MAHDLARSERNLPILELDLSDKIYEGELRRAIAERFGERVIISSRRDSAARVRIVSLQSVGDEASLKNVIAVGDADLATMVSLMSGATAIDHVACPRMLLHGSSLGILWTLLERKQSAPRFFGKGFQGRQVLIRDSERREQRIESVIKHAREHGAAERLCQQIGDVTEELLTNALYDAKAERDRIPADRTRRIRLDRAQACTITYGTEKGMFFVRVQDPYGSLRRERMLEVLHRCVQKGDVVIDPSCGGAGLGMMRIFDASSLVVVHVSPGISTEFLVGFDLKRRRSAAHDRAIHLFFEGGRG
jgi:hypothetical protein